jgi:hypothetical protein
VQSSRERRRKAEHFVRPATRCLVVIRTGVGILAKDRTRIDERRAVLLVELREHVRRILLVDRNRNAERHGSRIPHGERYDHRLASCVSARAGAQTDLESIDGKSPWLDDEGLADVGQVFLQPRTHALRSGWKVGLDDQANRHPPVRGGPRGDPRRLWLRERILPHDLSVAKQFDLSALKEDSLPEDLDAELLAREQAATYVQQTDG